MMATLERSLLHVEGADDFTPSVTCSSDPE